MALSSITKSVSIDALYHKVFAFLSNPASSTRWAVIDINEAVPGEGKWWSIRTPAGRAMLRVRSNPIYGVVDFDFDFADSRWTVPTRVIPNGYCCEYVVTIFAPEAFSLDLFGSQIALIERKLRLLKRLMEED